MKILNNEAVNKLNKSQYCIVSEYFNQYALGITGQTIDNKIIVPTRDKGFDNREQALIKAQTLGLKNKTIKGKEDHGTGSLGNSVEKYKICTINHALKKYSTYNFNSIN